MSMQDPIADMLTRIRNGQAANKVVYYQLAFLRPGISPRIAASRTLIRLKPNLRKTP